MRWTPDRPGEPGLQPDGSYITPEGDRLADEADKATYLHTVQDWLVAPQIKAVDGVAGIDSLGGFEKEYLVIPDLPRLASMGLSIADLATALERNNVATGGGTINRNGQGLAVRADARIRSLAQLGDTVIASREGAAIALRQVAQIRLGHGVRMGAGSENGREVVTGTAIMRIGENSRTVSSGVDAKLKAIAPSLPRDIVIEPVLDRTRLVNATISTVVKNLSEGALLVIVVLFALLGNFRAALIAALVIPVTMLLTGFGMLRLGVSANLMSLGALDFGLIVDGAVIIVENALRRIAERQHDREGALDLSDRLSLVAAAAREMIRPSVYGQAIIILVYVPLLTLSGVEGKTFEPMALTVIMALAFAFVLSLTFVPAAIAIAMSRPVKEEEARPIAWLRRHYEPGLGRAMARPHLTFGVALGALALGAGAYALLGQEFLPQLDEGDVLVSAMRVPGTSVEQSQKMQAQVERALHGMPEIRTVFSRTGTAEVASDPMPPNATDTFIMLKDRKDWPRPAEDKADVIARIEERIEKVPGHAYEVTQPIQMRFNELIAGVRSDVAVKVFGEDFAEMNATATKIAAVLRRIPGAEDVKVEQTEGLPMLDIAYARDRAAPIGVTAQDMTDTVAGAIAGRRAGRIAEGDRNFPIVIRL